MKQHSMRTGFVFACLTCVSLAMNSGAAFAQAKTSANPATAPAATDNSGFMTGVAFTGPDLVTDANNGLNGLPAVPASCQTLCTNMDVCAGWTFNPGDSNGAATCHLKCSNGILTKTSAKGSTSAYNTQNPTGAAAAAPPPPKDAFQTGVKYLGTDLVTDAQNGLAGLPAVAQSCQKLCSNMDACKAWSFTSHGQSGGPECHLKGYVPKSVKAGKWTSGVN